MNNKTVGAVLKEEEESDVTRHHPMLDDWLLLPSNCIATNLVCSRARSVALENNMELGMDVAYFERSIEVVVVYCACSDHTMYIFITCFCPKTLIMRAKRAYDVTTTSTSSNPT